MNATVSDPRVWERWRGAKQLALLAAFEDSATGTRVKEFCQSLALNLGQRCQIIERVWLFNTLRLRELQEIAAEEASASDLVVISVHEAESLPEEVTGWIELWLRQKGTRKAVLLALVDAGYKGADGSMEAYLREVARRGGMEFLVESRAAPETRWLER